ncbi:hypothetical protein LTR36_001653 [Oleoguttula mirabilis]|uniref:Uncharacterized protein n=1 Tax=Oleoguttula mirabilis TaxID=1507867 RepID=A0AAV9JPK7_9PEZI|nr:hypothetical protein LTR36_001653 [Oleoguttula mirabilis]
MVMPVINPLLQKQAIVTAGPVISTSFGSVRRPLLVSVDAVIASYNSARYQLRRPPYQASINMIDFLPPGNSWAVSASRPRPNAILVGMPAVKATVPETMGDVWWAETLMGGGCGTVGEYLAIVEVGRGEETWETGST